MSTTTAAVLRRARELIEYGWAQGTDEEYRNGRTCHCLVGAIVRAVSETIGDSLKIRTSALDAVRTQIDKDIINIIGKGNTRLIDWNDRPNRTKAEVVDVLRRAALAEEMSP